MRLAKVRKWGDDLVMQRASVDVAPSSSSSVDALPVDAG